jgi:predicted ATPase
MDDARLLLTRLRAENVRSFAYLDLELGPLTVLVGPNGAGKSNIVALLRYVRDGMHKGARSALHMQRGWESFVRRGRDRAIVKCDFNMSDTDMRHVGMIKGQGSGWLEISTMGVPEYLASFESGLDADKKPHELVQSIGRGSEVSGQDEGVSGAREALERIAIYQPESTVLRDRVQRTDSEPSLHEDLSNLGAVLLAIRGTPFGDELDRALALLVDGVTGYAVARAGSTLVPQILYATDDVRDLGLESDGTIRLVALLAALYQPIPPSLVVLEEPEMGLHPGVLSALAEIIGEASTRMQVLVTTHSPDLIDGFDPEVIRVVEKVNGESVVGRIDPAQRDLIHRRLYQPSDLMRIEGLVREP